MPPKVNKKGSQVDNPVNPENPSQVPEGEPRVDLGEEDGCCHFKKSHGSYAGGDEQPEVKTQRHLTNCPFATTGNRKTKAGDDKPTS